MPANEIRQLREDAPSNLATLCYKAVEKLVKAVDNSCRTQHEQLIGMLTGVIKLFVYKLILSIIISTELCKTPHKVIALYF